MTAHTRRTGTNWSAPGNGGSLFVRVAVVTIATEMEIPIATCQVRAVFLQHRRCCPQRHEILLHEVASDDLVFPIVVTEHDFAAVIDVNNVGDSVTR